MKRVAFAWITEWIDFTNYDEAIAFVIANSNKGWRFIIKNEAEQGVRWGIVPQAIVYENGNDDYPFTVQYEKPYRQYNMG